MNTYDKRFIKSKILNAVRESFSDFKEIERQEGAKIERERIIEKIEYLISHTYKCRYEANELPEDEYMDGLLVGRLEILEILKKKIENEA